MRNLQRVNDLVFWKSTYITWRNVVERAKDPRPIIRFRNTAKRVVQRIEARILVCLVLGLLIVAGCTSSATLGVSSSVYYPKDWESPESREQHTQPTVGMARNNLPMVGAEK